MDILGIDATTVRCIRVKSVTFNFFRHGLTPIYTDYNVVISDLNKIKIKMILLKITVNETVSGAGKCYNN